MFTVNDRFILAEELALKQKFQGLTVTDPRNGSGIDVDVWFRWPNKEVREVTYPFIALDLVDTVRSERREHSGNRLRLRYTPNNYAPDLDPNLSVPVADEWPTPYDLIYTATVVSLDPRHDRQLKAMLLGDPNRIPMRWGHIDVEDQTTRRLDVIDVSSTVARDAARTQFFTVFTLNVESELFVSALRDVWRVQSASITLREILTGVTETLHNT